MPNAQSRSIGSRGMVWYGCGSNISTPNGSIVRVGAIFSEVHSHQRIQWRFQPCLPDGPRLPSQGKGPRASRASPIYCLSICQPLFHCYHYLSLKPHAFLEMVIPVVWSFFYDLKLRVRCTTSLLSFHRSVDQCLDVDDLVRHNIYIYVCASYYFI